MYHFIVNLQARSGKGRETWDIVEEELNNRGIEYNAYFTEHNYHGTELAKSLTFDGKTRKIVVVGGDGTLNEVVSGIIRLDTVTLGYIPAGSSNDLARSLKMPTNPLKALEAILKPKYYTMMDVGELHYGGNKRRFLVSTGMGFDAAICYLANHTDSKEKLNKLKLGNMTYTAIALKLLFKRQNFKATITLDDVKKQSFKKVIFIATMNCKYEGGGYKFCPDAEPNDRKLDVVVFDSISLPRILALMPIAKKGLHKNVKGVHIYQASKVEIFAEGGRQPVHLDGEAGFFQSNVIIKCADSPIKLICASKI